MKLQRLFGTLFLVCLGSPLGAQTPLQMPTGPKASFVKPPELKWEAGPEGWPVGTKMAVLDGYPGRVGPYTVRLKLPAGYKVGSHWNSADQRIVVLSGLLNIGLGEKVDKAKAQRLTTGSFAFMPKNATYYLWVDQETILQIHGNGPWTNTLAEPVRPPSADETP